MDYVGDIVDYDGLSDALNGVDGVLHLAAVSRVIDAELDKVECTRVNALGTSRVLEEASQMGCKWFIFGSSREVYGEPTSFPVMEEDGVNPINHYGHAKVEGERMVHEHCEQHGMAHSNLRFSNVYGHPGDHPTRLVNAFLRRALKSEPLEIHGGGQVFDFTHLDDTVSAVTKRQKHCRKTNFSPADPCTTRNTGFDEDLARHVLEITGSKSNVSYTEGRDYGVERFHGDPSRLRNCLDMSAVSTFVQVWSGVPPSSEIILLSRRVILNEGLAGDSRIPPKVQCRI